MKKKLLIGLAAVLVIGLIWGGKYGLDFMYYEKTMPTVVIKDVDFAKIADGVYTGSFNAKIIAATTKVTVENGKVTDIQLTKHKYERGDPAEAIVDDVLKEQTLMVDAVSGATESSKAILKAIENALDK